MTSHLVSASWLPAFQTIEWLPLCGGLTALGLVLSWRAWRRRGVAAGLRGAAWSLLPLAADLTGVIQVLWRTFSAVVDFAWSSVFTVEGWTGIGLTGLAVVLFAISGVMRGRGGKKAGGAGSETPTAETRAVTAGKPGSAVSTATGAGHDDLGDVAEILKRHGIR